MEIKMTEGEIEINIKSKPNELRALRNALKNFIEGMDDEEEDGDYEDGDYSSEYYQRDVAKEVIDAVDSFLNVPKKKPGR